MTDSYLEIVEQCIKELVEKFERKPFFFISESDVKCYLYYLLASKQALQRTLLTKDKKLTSIIHTEYLSALGLPVDLVIFDPNHVKNFTLKKQKVMCQIEIKWRRSTIRFNKKEQKELRARLIEDRQAHKYFIYLYQANKQHYWQEFIKDFTKYKEASEEVFLKSVIITALASRIRPGPP